MIDKDKRYRTPSGEIVTGAELVEVPRTAEDVVFDTLVQDKGWYDADAREIAAYAITALREAGMLPEPEAKLATTLEVVSNDIMVDNPDPDGWIKHDGGPCPLHPNVRAHAEFNDGGPPAVNRAGLFNWGAVTHYRVVGA